jgi:integrase
MSTSPAGADQPVLRWQWPVDLDAYDRRPHLSEAERAALAAWVAHPPRPSQAWTAPPLPRLVAPLTDTLAAYGIRRTGCRDAIQVIALEMHRRGTAFWVWSADQWQETLTVDVAAFGQRYGWHYKPYLARTTVCLLAYVLCHYTDWAVSGRAVLRLALARKIFGTAELAATMERMTSVLYAWGYTQKLYRHLLSALCYVLLLNRSPRLEDLSSDLLAATQRQTDNKRIRAVLYQLSRVLVTVGLSTQPLAPADRRPPSEERDARIAAEWQHWCLRWLRQSTLQRPRAVYYTLLKVGRWLQACHPEVSSPAHWTPALAAEFVAAVDGMRVGEWIDQVPSRASAARVGQPLRPKAKAQHLRAMRTFLLDCQEWTWIPVRLNPARCLRTPRAINNLIGPDPRVIDLTVWAKIVWAALNLTEVDLPHAGGTNVGLYPLAMVRAIAAVWCFAALRSDEIRRLRVGCVRWQREDVVVPSTGDVLPREAVCLLDIPVNKTSTAYTKPTHPLVGQRIEAWERVRPPDQRRQLDAKTSEAVHYLFSYRGRNIGTQYLNTVLIPLLCRKAGVPDQDARGKITAHRARATIASLLYNAKEPLSLYELMEYLGHKQLSSTQHYAKIDQTKLASSVAKAGYLEQQLATIEVLLDQDAVLSGAAASGAPWKFYDLGHGYCTHTFWATCPHRMACARCPFYRPKQATADQLAEGQANLVRMLEFVALTEDERALVEEGIDLHQALIAKLADVPTPAGPTPRELTARGQALPMHAPTSMVGAARPSPEAGEREGAQPSPCPVIAAESGAPRLDAPGGAPCETAQTTGTANV